jgi:hypothetical protein
VSLEEATTAVIDALDAQCVPYMLVGSLSTAYYGTACLTSDVDFVVQLEIGKLPALMTQLGPRFLLNPKMTIELPTAARRCLVELADKSCLVELFLLSEDSHDVERFFRRRKVRFLDRHAFLPTVEDAIVTKLRWFHAGQRRKDIQDARSMIAIQGDHIDWPYVYTWCDQHGTRELLDQVRRSPQAK